MPDKQTQLPRQIERRHTLRRSTDASQSKMLPLDEVMRTCAISRTSVYDSVSRGDFPPPVELLTGLNALGQPQSAEIRRSFSYFFHTHY
nr:AlpA family phage regulatory protein [uncultured Duganella sp.]